MVTLEDYNDNTFDPIDFNVTIYYIWSKNIRSRYKEEFLLTNELGKCLYYEMDEKVLWLSRNDVALGLLFKLN